MYSTECHLLNDIALKAATNENVEVLMGLWIDRDFNRNSQEVADLITYLEMYPHAKLIGIAVGNEVLFRQSMHANVLAGIVWDVKQKVWTELLACLQQAWLSFLCPGANAR